MSAAVVAPSKKGESYTSVVEDATLLKKETLESYTSVVEDAILLKKWTLKGKEGVESNVLASVLRGALRVAFEEIWMQRGSIMEVPLYSPIPTHSGLFCITFRILHDWCNR